MDSANTYTAFAGTRRIASGSLEELLRATKTYIDSRPPAETVLIFDDETGKELDFDFRGSTQDVLDRALPKPARTGPGRPRLGVLSREVTLLPRHWEWLDAQPNGASAGLRRLVEEAAKRDRGEFGIRRKIDAAGRVMTVLAGNLPGFEEAYRALYARNLDGLERQIAGWPEDVRAYVLERLRPVLAPAMG